jgi:hypothetical protein
MPISSGTKSPCQVRRYGDPAELSQAHRPAPRAFFLIFSVTHGRAVPGRGTMSALSSPPNDPTQWHGAGLTCG